MKKLKKIVKRPKCPECGEEMKLVRDRGLKGEWYATWFCANFKLFDNTCSQGMDYQPDDYAMQTAAEDYNYLMDNFND